MSTTWFSSDIHFEHNNIINFCNRPWDNVDDMGRGIIDNFKSVVDPEDTLILVGDLCMGRKDRSIPLLGELPGVKILVPGNHDPMHPAYEKRDWKRDAWKQRYGAEANVVVYPPHIQSNIGGTMVDVCHFPYEGDHTEDERFVDYRPVDVGRWLIHGHVHDMWKVNGRQINVGVDVWDYFPVNIDTIKGIINDD